MEGEREEEILELGERMIGTFVVRIMIFLGASESVHTGFEPVLGLCCRGNKGKLVAR